MNKIEVKMNRIDDWRIRIEKASGMRVPGIIYADRTLMKAIETDASPSQVANVASLPGIVKNSLAMPDIHWGYGFPIGGVAAFTEAEGIISPGGVGYDINCGCRLMRTDLSRSDVQARLEKLLRALYITIPAGVGSTSKLKLSRSELKKVLRKGSRWAMEKGFGEDGDLERTEDYGCMDGADPDMVSDKALSRGSDQLGTLGSGNHFLEVGYVEEIFDKKAAAVMGLAEEEVTVMIHSGSRGLGYQVCDDFLEVMQRAAVKYGIDLPDRQLACAYWQTPEGREYFAGMCCAANFAWTNRQIMMSWTRDAFGQALGISPRELNMRLVYDVCHNIAKREKHIVDGKPVALVVHRKGATRAFPGGHEAVPEVYRAVGQPVLVPGDMGTESYVLVGTQGAMEETFGSTCHGAGRVLSRRQAKKQAKKRNIEGELREKGILVMASSRATLVEEMPEAYKDVGKVVDVVHNAGIARKVARLKPLGVVKG